MRLSYDEVILFYKIWFPLLHFVNQKLKVVKAFPDKWGDTSVDTEDAAKICIKMWENDHLLDEFVQQNPHNLANEELDIVRQWKYHITDTFFLFRYLKKYTVFISQGSPNRAYGVLGLVSSFDEMFGNNLPILAQTTLLPFNGKIIYDSLIAPYPVMFGGGYKSELTDTYRSIQEREGVILSLPFDPNAIEESIVTKSNKKIINEFDKHLGRSGLGAKKALEHIDNIEQFAEDFLTNVKPPTFLLDLDKQVIDVYLRQSKKKVNIVSLRHFIRFMRDTYRIYYEDAEDILRFLKDK